MSMKLIATTTLGSDTSNIEFTNIPGTYTDLVVYFSGRSTGDNQFTTWRDVQLTFNGSTSNYSWRHLEGNGSSVSSSGGTSQSSIFLGTAMPDSATTSNTFSSSYVYIPNYAGSTNKSVSFDNVTENNATQAQQMIVAGLWADSAAITSLKLTASADNMAANSIASLYGITKGSDGIVTTS
jgi:hypothetical protein